MHMRLREDIVAKTNYRNPLKFGKNLQMMKKLKIGHSLSEPGICRGGGEALVEAAAEGKVREVQGLIGCPGVDINYANSLGETGLWYASFKGHLQVVKLLLSTPGIDVNQARRTDIGATPLFMASHFGHVEVVKELLAHQQINVNQGLTTTGATPLFIASQNGHVEVVKELLAHPQINVNQATADGSTPLLAGSHLEVVKELLADQRVDPNKIRTDDKDNAIIIAADFGELEVVKLLLQCPKVVLGVKNKYGKTELDYAREGGHPDMVNAIQSRKTLLQLGHTC